MVEDQVAQGASGFAMGYARNKGEFRVYACMFFGVVLAAGGILKGSEIASITGLLFLITSYYFYPLIETQKVRIGAGEHGIFIEGFGIIPWRSVQSLELKNTVVRTMRISELNIKLSQGLPSALIADWRSLPWYRLLMKLPWTMGRDNVVRINLEPFAAEPEKILDAMQRTRRYFSGRH